MSVYFVAQGRIENRELHDEYVARALPTFPPEVKVIVFDLEPEELEGPVTHPRTVILEFPSREAFRSWYDSPEYREVLPMRLESVAGTAVVAEGFVPPVDSNE